MYTARILVSIMILCFVVGTAAAEVPIVNLVQWQTAQGGNDHWYAVIAQKGPWVDQEATARTLVMDTMHGYLATVLSLAENQFIVDQVIKALEPDAVYDQYYIGLYKGPGGWGWVTGEPVSLFNWDMGEPSGDGNGSGMWGWDYARQDPQLRSLGKWNDVPEDTTGRGAIHQLWAVVEWGGSDTAMTPSDTLLNVVKWEVANGGNGHRYGVIAKKRPWNYQKAYAETLIHGGRGGHLATIGSAEENQFIVDHVIRGVRSDAIVDQFYIGLRLTIPGTTQWQWITAEPLTFVNWDSREPSGDGPGSGMWGWDYARSVSENLRKLGKWNDVPVDTVGIGPIHQLWGIVEWDALCGDVNGDEAVNAADLILLLEYYFYFGGPVSSGADVNGNGRVELSDVVALGQYLSGGLVSPCASEANFDRGGIEHYKGEPVRDFGSPEGTKY